MALNNIFVREFTRIRVVLAVMIAALVFLTVFLWQLQVISAHKYQGSVAKQSVRCVRLPGTRGRILDRYGVPLADNRPSYCIAIYIEELRLPGRSERTVDRIEKVLSDLSAVLGIERSVTRDDIKNHIRTRPYMPFLVWKDIDDTVLARFAESNVKFPGVDIYVEPLRVYPDGEVAAHVLGYVSKADIGQNKTEIDQTEDDMTYNFYLPEMQGKSGIELFANDILTGIPGGRLICVDVSGFKKRDPRLTEFERDRKISEHSPRPGRDVTLTIDIGIQRLIEQAITNATGAAVVIDPRNGDVLALASSPGFDPNRFSTGMSAEEFKKITQSDDNPLFNRAISGLYPPGSVFKPVVIMAALGSNKAGEGTRYDCPGYFQLGKTVFHCWCKEGHGNIGMKKAIEQSCNAYFCQLGLLTGEKAIQEMAVNAGFGRRTGIDLKMELAGLVPDEQRKKRVDHDAWRKGDTCNLSIGQGALNVTPVQVAVFAAAIANGGSVYRPRLIKTGNADGDLIKKLDWSKEHLKILRGGMYDVIQADTGTGKRARIPDVEMAGKTGTAEYGVKGSGKKYGWMIVFAPFEKPRYAIVMVVEEAISGGVTIAPRIREVAQGIFAIERSKKAIIDSRTSQNSEGKGQG